MRTAVPSKIVSSTVPLAPHPKGTSYGDAEASPSGRSTQRQGDKRSAAADLIASHAPLRGGRHTARPASSKTLPRGFKGPPIGAPPKPNVSGFGGERRSSGTTELLPRKAKRRMWSLRRRGTPFSPIFRRATKDGAPGGPAENTMRVKTKNKKAWPPEGVGIVERLVKT